ncbi:MAG: WecB/TagA/CpsF family glycosyltransferase [Anaerolineales bacterium]|jgi:N-acetylglucosaminyldiphosphoundecaprenol N-acetyl-beta-D-mannosaminyltransferase
MKSSVLETWIDITSYTDATIQIKDWALAEQSRYVCIANVHVIMEAHDSINFRKAINSSDLVTPDGMPLVWLLRLKGVKKQTRVYGPTLMLHVLGLAAREKIPVGLYGGDNSTLEILEALMLERFPGLLVVYKFSPPFRPLDKQESTQIIENIAASGARILFVGLGCPKQEIWMAEHNGKVQAVMLGVGAAFDFLAGTKPQAPGWMQAVGLEWFFRFTHEPRRLARRYLYNNPRFLFLSAADLLGILGKRNKEA